MGREHLYSTLSAWPNTVSTPCEVGGGATFVPKKISEGGGGAGKTLNHTLLSFLDFMQAADKLLDGDKTIESCRHRSPGLPHGTAQPVGYRVGPDTALRTTAPRQYSWKLSGTNHSLRSLLVEDTSGQQKVEDLSENAASQDGVIPSASSKCRMK